MIRGITVSTLIHASVLAMAMMSWPSPKSECDTAIDKLRRENPGIRAIEIMMQLPQCAAAADLPIDFEDVGLVSNVSDLRKADEPVQEAVPPEPEEEVLPETPPEPEPEAAEPEPETPVPDPRKEPEPEPKKPEPKKPEPKKPEPLIKKPEPKKPEPKKDDLAFLDDFDKALQDKKSDRARTPQETPDRPALGNADRDRTGSGDRTGNTASLQAAIRRQVGYCWRGIEDLPAEDQIDVVIKMELDRTGNLVANATLVSPRSRPVGRSGLAVDLALRAVRKCAPYNLPEDAYEQWKDIEVTIGPKQG